MGSSAPLQNALLLRSDPIGLFSRLARSGERISVIALPASTAYQLHAPDLVAQVLLDGTGKLRKYQFAGLLEAFGSGILNSAGSVHATVRRAAQPAFHRPQIEKWSETISAMMEESLAPLVAEREFDIKALFERATLLIVGRLLFALDLRAIVPAFFECVEQMQRLFQQAEASPLAAERFREASQRLDRLLEQTMREQPQARTEGTLFRSFDATGELDEQQISEELRGFLMANLPASLLLATASWLLAEHPQYQATLREQDTADWLDPVINETLRLYPPGWLLAREAVEPFEMNDAWFPPGAVFLICVFTLHRSPNLFPEPDQFWPERWKSIGTLPRGAYIPFSLGARNCLGERLTRMIAAHGLPQLLKRFRLAPSDRGGEIQWLPRITFSPATSMWLKLHQHPEA